MYFNEHLKYNYDSNDNIAGWSVSSKEIKLHTVTVQFIIWKIWKLFHVFINLDLDMVSPFFFTYFLNKARIQWVRDFKINPLVNIHVSAKFEPDFLQIR